MRPMHRRLAKSALFCICVLLCLLHYGLLYGVSMYATTITGRTPITVTSAHEELLPHGRRNLASPATPTPVPTAGGSSALGRGMTILISTVPRFPGGPLGAAARANRDPLDYLDGVLAKLAAGIRSEPRIRVKVMNHVLGNHSAFENNRIRYATNPQFQFVYNQGTNVDPTPKTVPDPDDNNNPSNRPGRFVRQQTCDFATLIDAADTSTEYIMLMEDDFEICDEFVKGAKDAITGADEWVPKWICLRVSYGMNGIIIRTADVQTLKTLLMEGVSRLPADILLREWVRRYYPRKMAVYQTNLMNHVGEHSSLPRPDRPPFPKCGRSMAHVWSLPREEQFQLECKHAAVSPCGRRN